MWGSIIHSLVCGLISIPVFGYLFSSHHFLGPLEKSIPRNTIAATFKRIFAMDRYIVIARILSNPFQASWFFAGFVAHTELMV